MSAPREDGAAPSVYARLAAEEEIRFVRRTPPRSARWVGMALCLAIAVVILMAALRVHPW
ncbi:MAG: hypothetical protein AB7V42_07160 [Thermoleophilia bacterium]